MTGQSPTPEQVIGELVALRLEVTDVLQRAYNAGRRHALHDAADRIHTEYVPAVIPIGDWLRTLAEENP